MDTKSAIIEGFKASFEKKNFNDVTISDICEEGNVSRKTFYNHFSTKQEVLEEIIKVDFIYPVYRVRNNMFSENLPAMELTLTEQTYKTFYNKRDFYLKVIRDLGRGIFADMFIKADTALNMDIYGVEGDANNSVNGEAIDKTELSYMSMFLSCSTCYSLFWWIDNNFEPSSARMAQLYSSWTLSHVHRDNIYKKNGSIGGMK